MIAFATALADHGIDVVTFNFLYMERKRRTPDPTARLEACFRTVIAETRTRMEDGARRLVVGGKSMGGRIASQVIAAETKTGGATADGLVFLGCPLHHPGRPDKLRDTHPPTITVPMLFVQGSRDTFGTPDEVRSIAERCRSAELHVVEGGDHSLKVRDKEASTSEAYASVQERITVWIKALAAKP